MALDPDLLEALASPEGRALLEETGRRLLAGESELRAGTALRAAHPPGLVAAAMEQWELRRRATAKFTRAEQMMFTRDGLEQASGEGPARWRAGRLHRQLGGVPVADLCCGIGGDLLALGEHHPVRAVDRDPVAVQVALHNAEVYGVTDVTGEVADVSDVDLAGVAAVFIDPARRAAGRRYPGRSSPPVAWCLGLAAHTPAVVVKAAPGLPLTEVPPAWEAEFVAHGRDLKEAVLWSPALATAPRRASVLPGGTSLAGVPGTVAAPVGPVARFLCDPNPAVTRAGLVGQLAAAVDAWQLDPRIAFLTADAAPPTPFGRWLRVAATLPWDVAQLRATLRRLDVGAVDVRRRGLAGDVDAVRRSLRLKGTRRAVVAMTRLADAPWAVVATPLDDPPLA